MKHYFLRIIVFGAVLFSLQGCELLETHSRLLDRDNFALLYYVGDDLKDAYYLTSFKLVENQDLVFEEVITMDDPFHSTECFLSYQKQEILDVRKWGSWEIHRNLYRGEYIYATGGVFSQILWKKAIFDFIGEEVFSDGRQQIGLPKMHIQKVGDTIKEYLEPKEGEYEHVMLYMQLAVVRHADGKKLSDLPIVFDVVRTTESVFNEDIDVIVLSGKTKSTANDDFSLYPEL